MTDDELAAIDYHVVALVDDARIIARLLAEVRRLQTELADAKERQFWSKIP